MAWLQTLGDLGNFGASFYYFFDHPNLYAVGVKKLTPSTNQKSWYQ